MPYFRLSCFIFYLIIDLLCSYLWVTELERDSDEDQIKFAYRRLAKFYHPDGLSLSSLLLIMKLMLYFHFINV